MQSRFSCTFVQDGFKRRGQEASSQGKAEAFVLRDEANDALAEAEMEEEDDRLAYQEALEVYSIGKVMGKGKCKDGKDNGKGKDDMDKDDKDKDDTDKPSSSQLGCTMIPDLVEDP